MRPIGIDFGTTNSLVAAPSRGGVEVLTDDGEYLTPSAVHIDSGTASVGEDAVSAAIKQPSNTVFSVKRALATGKEYDIDGTSYTPVEISSLIFKDLLSTAETAVDERPDRGVVTVPAKFTPAQRQAVKSAAELAGLEIERLLPEPTAACLAHGLRNSADATVLVLDLGGGTFDVSLVEVSNGVFDVVRSNGCPSLGGDDWGGAIFEWITESIAKEHGVKIDPESAPVAAEQIFEAAKSAKEDLTETTSTRINIPYLHHEELDRLEYQPSRDRFDSLTANLRSQVFNLTDELLKAEGLYRGTQRPIIDDLVLVGGATRMPQIKQAVHRKYSISPARKTDPDTTVALGAAAQASLLDDVDLVARKSTATAVDTQRGYSGSLDKTGAPSLVPADSHPDDIVLIDSVAEPIGLVSRKGYYQEHIIPIFEKGQSIPCKATQTFTYLDHNMRKAIITITRGDPGAPLEDIIFDEFRLGPTRALPRKEAEIEVTLSIDVNGLLTVRAEETHNNVSSEVILDGSTVVRSGDQLQSTRLSESEIRQYRSQLPKLEE